MTIRAFAGLAAGALLLAVCIVMLWPLGAFAAARCPAGTVSASWYGTESGSRTASGDYFDGTSLTAAMPSRKHLGERYRITYRGKSVVVRINDVGPAKRLGRAIDLSRAAAAKIGMISVGVACVKMERL